MLQFECECLEHEVRPLASTWAGHSSQFICNQIPAKLPDYKSRTFHPVKKAFYWSRERFKKCLCETGKEKKNIFYFFHNITMTHLCKLFSGQKALGHQSWPFSFLSCSKQLTTQRKSVFLFNNFQEMGVSFTRWLPIFNRYTGLSFSMSSGQTYTVYKHFP